MNDNDWVLAILILLMVWLFQVFIIFSIGVEEPLTV